MKIKRMNFNSSFTDLSRLMIGNMDSRFLIETTMNESTRKWRNALRTSLAGKYSSDEKAMQLVRCFGLLFIHFRLI